MSNFLKLNIADFVKGIIVAALAAAGTVLIASLNAGQLPDLVTLEHAGAVALSAGLAYLVKNFLTNSSGEPFNSETK